jgi:prepilin signal peptidase PulO-like enzyme (type II secretory pathway)
MQEMEELYRIFAGILGLLVGSFLNVIIHRLPQGKDIVVARSACPCCGNLISWYFNIPVVAWLYLRGKCSHCDQKIHWRYPLIELSVGLVFYVTFPSDMTYYPLLNWFFKSYFFCVLTCHFFIDLKHRLLLDKLNLALFVLVLPFSLIFYAPMHWLMGAVIGFAAPYGVSWAFYKLKGKIGLGGGDIKLWTVLGLFLGPFGIMENIFLSCLLGSIVGVGLIAFKKYDRDLGIPFGPFIIIVSLLQLYFPHLPKWLGLSLF